ncbi:MAG: hypothetical protein B6244_01780 [Candidatus Cloacimonetes bacterium 4572_55]|nr:MAG: hypothetical protein B6244_01780 [Candidatus Cloacimonetes bacterium 4572_55]
MLKSHKLENGLTRVKAIVDFDSQAELDGFHRFSAESRHLIEARLRDYLDQQISRSSNVYSNLYGAIDYTLFAGGKRIRSALMLAISDMLSGDRDVVLDAACAVEMIHTSSLIIDDLPSMDNADFRRGKPSIHKIYGEAVAVLAGFSLLNMAFGILSQPKHGADVSPDLDRWIIHEFSEAVGLNGMIGGQFIELEHQDQDISLPMIEDIHNKKTGILFVAALRSAALISSASDQELAALTAYSEFVGLMFQVSDDLLDLIGDEGKLGKPTQADLRKTTYVDGRSIDSVRETIRSLGNRAIQALEIFDNKAKILRDIVRYLTRRET